jgi:hypothetical protein
MSRLALLFLALGAIPARAQGYDAAPVVSVAAESGSAGVVHAALDVAAPPRVVWAVLTDCADAPSHMPGLLSCKILERGPGDAWQVREHRLKGPFIHPVMRNVFRLEMKPYDSLSFRRVAGDWKRSDGAWGLTPIPGGTHVTYELHVAVEGPAPAGMVRASVAKGMPASLLALRREAVARAAPTPDKDDS